MKIHPVTNGGQNSEARLVQACFPDASQWKTLPYITLGETLIN
uniref:Uncharacterized protein n=1 Tax=Anguilla anguilla TaxID=7936 RepID=A0A0E9TTU7_ANGAN